MIPGLRPFLSASAVRLRAFIRPAYSIGSLDESEVVGVLRYGLRGSRSPVLGDGTVTLMVANGENGGQCLRMMINELEPAVVPTPLARNVPLFDWGRGTGPRHDEDGPGQVLDSNELGPTGYHRRLQ